MEEEQRNHIFLSLLDCSRNGKKRVTGGWPKSEAPSTCIQTWPRSRRGAADLLVLLTHSYIFALHNKFPLMQAHLRDWKKAFMTVWGNLMPKFMPWRSYESIDYQRLVQVCTKKAFMSTIFASFSFPIIKVHFETSFQESGPPYVFRIGCRFFFFLFGVSSSLVCRARESNLAAFCTSFEQSKCCYDLNLLCSNLLKP